MIISNQFMLKEVCQRFATAPFITVDTEFIREKTYYPKLCLIQMASPEEAVCIDPLVPDFDWEPIRQLMQNDSVVKVFHACHQDIEIFFGQAGVMPKPLFDTQVAAMVFGFGDCVGYQAVVKQITGVSLDKSMRYTDWQKRPLTEQQIQYALCDVTYLRDVYRYFSDKLSENKRFEWIQDEMTALMNPEIYCVNPDQIWMRFKTPLNEGIQLYLFSKLCAWRERVAQSLNRPRRHIMKDEALYEIAILKPQKSADFDQMRHLPNGFSKSKWVDRLLDLVANETQVFQTEIKKFTYPVNPTVPPSKKMLNDLIRLLLDLVCEKKKIAPKLLASNTDIADFLCGHPCRFSSGWRYEQFGRLAENLKNGKLSFTYNPIKDSVDFGM